MLFTVLFGEWVYTHFRSKKEQYQGILFVFLNLYYRGDAFVKFIEDGFDVDFHSPVHFVRSFVVMMLTAPYKLVMTISSKILYLPRDALVRVAANSALVAVVILVANVAIQLYFGRFSLLGGKFPVIIMIGAVITLASLYVWTSMTDFRLYTELEELFPESLQEPSTEQGEPTEPMVEQSGPAKPTPVEPSVQEDLQSKLDSVDFTFDDFDQEPEVGDSISVATRFDSAGIGEKVGIQLKGQEREEFLQKLEDSTDPSEFLSENLLLRFNEKEEIIDDLNLRVLGMVIIPNDFRALV